MCHPPLTVFTVKKNIYKLQKRFYRSKGNRRAHNKVLNESNFYIKYGYKFGVSVCITTTKRNPFKPKDFRVTLIKQEHEEDYCPPRKETTSPSLFGDNDTEEAGEHSNIAAPA